MSVGFDRALSFGRAVGFLILILVLQVGCSDGATPVGPDDLANAKRIVDLRKAGEPVRLTALSNGEICDILKERLTADYSLEKIEVPEDWSSQTSPKIKVAYYYSKAKMDAGQTPVIFFNGGPGGASAGSYRVLVLNKKDIESAFNNLNFVFIDQRGNGCSQEYPEVNSESDVARLKNYTSRSIVKDAEAIRQKIWGDRPWKIFGQSYGGFIVRRYLEVAPAIDKRININVS